MDPHSLFSILHRTIPPSRDRPPRQTEYSWRSPRPTAPSPPPSCAKPAVSEPAHYPRRLPTSSPPAASAAALTATPSTPRHHPFPFPFPSLYRPLGNGKRENLTPHPSLIPTATPSITVIALIYGAELVTVPVTGPTTRAP